MTIGGFITYHWRRGRMVPKRGSEEIADSAPFTCGGCGETFDGNREPPFELEKTVPLFGVER